MEYITIALTALFSVAALFVLTKLMGERQISQLNFFDYITGITIGSIAAEMATSLEDTPIKPLIAMIVYALLTVLINVITSKSLVMRKIFTGTPTVIMNNGVIYRKNLKKARLDLGDFLTLARIAGYFDLNQIQTALLEHNGNISFLPKASEHPVTPAELSLAPPESTILLNVISDGRVIEKNLKSLGKNTAWLKTKLKEMKYSSEREIYLATCDKDGNISAYTSGDDALPPDIVE